MNLYAYVGNDPINATDPTGEFGVIGFIAGFAADAVAQYIEKGSVDLRQSAVSGAAGALTGGVGSVYKTAGMITKAVINTGTNVTSSVAAGAINTELSGGDATLAGAVKDGALAVGGIANTVKKIGGSAVKGIKAISNSNEVKGVPSNFELAKDFSKNVATETATSVGGASVQASLKNQSNKLKENKI